MLMLWHNETWEWDTNNTIIKKARLKSKVKIQWRFVNQTKKKDKTETERQPSQGKQNHHWLLGLFGSPKMNKNQKCFSLALFKGNENNSTTIYLKF